MSRAELIDTIVRIEWEDFLHVNNEGGVASCQRRPDTFKIMRTSLLQTYSDELLESYLDDVSTASATGRSLMTEKYAWMMENTDDTAFKQIESRLPLLPYEVCERIEHIVKFFLVWQAQANVLFPRMAEGGRPLLSEDDKPDSTSFESYLRGELKSYSASTIAIYERYAPLRTWTISRATTAMPMPPMPSTTAVGESEASRCLTARLQAEDRRYGPL